MTSRSPKHVILTVSTAWDTVQIRFPESSYQKAVAGEPNFRDSICIRVKAALRKKGGFYNWISWTDIAIIGVKDDRNDPLLTNSEDTVADLSEEDQALYYELFNPGPYIQPEHSSTNPCGCVP